MTHKTKPSGSSLMPGAVVGIVGGGQLGRMMSIAASRLGFHSAILAPDDDAPAVQVSHHHIKRGYDDPFGYSELSDIADVVTYELEQIPLNGLQAITDKARISPNLYALEVSQDRAKEKQFLNVNQVPTTAWKECRTIANVETALNEFGCDSILKVAFGGYDGKGQTRIHCNANASEISKIWEDLAQGNELVTILEATVEFKCEISVVVARDERGRIEAYDPVRNHHKDHILEKTIIPAGIDTEVSIRAQTLASMVAEALDYVGVMCLEMFITQDDKLLANEIAPRPHNSGHWTLDACYTDQFEQHIRAICGLPLGSAQRFADATMQNILGTEHAAVSKHLSDPNARIHLYGKSEWRTGRKMGHVTILERFHSNTANGNSAE